MIEGKVARVLNTRELVINRGSEHGVEKGMVFEVLDTTGSEIRDPDTGDVLGSVYRAKVRVRVTIVEPLLCVARTFRTRQKNVGGSGGSLSAILGARIEAPPRWVTEYETFKAEEAAWENLPESQSYVKVGDPVREVPAKPAAPVEVAKADDDTAAVDNPGASQVAESA